MQIAFIQATVDWQLVTDVVAADYVARGIGTSFSFLPATSYLFEARDGSCILLQADDLPLPTVSAGNTIKDEPNGIKLAGYVVGSQKLYLKKTDGSRPCGVNITQVEV
jgi:hypothetical protein